jgi:thioredoxin reductase (NADPH)
MTDYEVAVIGGGPAGLTTALYTTRLNHDTVVIDRGGGRCAMMADTHNTIGISEDTSGVELLQQAKQQVIDHGADWHRSTVTAVERSTDGFVLETGSEETLSAERVVIATGFNDNHPEPPAPRTARGLHYCLHCDAYMFRDEPVYVMGNDDTAAHVAMIMLNFTDTVDILLRGEDPVWSDEVAAQVEGHPVSLVDAEIAQIHNGEDGWLEAIEFETGEKRDYRGGFAMHGADYNNHLAATLDCDINDDGTIVVDDHGQTTTDGVYAVGDITEGHNQIPVRMGQGAKAGIDIHYNLRTYPLPVEELPA